MMAPEFDYFLGIKSKYVILELIPSLDISHDQKHNNNQICLRDKCCYVPDERLGFISLRH